MFPEIFRDDVFRLETQRLWLRWPTARDEPAIERHAGDIVIAEMTSRIPHPYPKGAAARFIYDARVGNAQGTRLTFVLAPLARPTDTVGALLNCTKRTASPCSAFGLPSPCGVVA